MIGAMYLVFVCWKIKNVLKFVANMFHMNNISHPLTNLLNNLQKINKIFYSIYIRFH